MTTTMQSDIHPDAESLNAFVEHALRSIGARTGGVLAHLAEVRPMPPGCLSLAHDAAAIEQV